MWSRIFTWVCVLCLAYGSSVFADDAPSAGTFKSSKANDAVRKYQAARKKLDEGYDKLRKDNKADLVTKLEDTLNDATKAGNLDEAVVIRDAIKVLKTGDEPSIPAGQTAATAESDTKEGKSPAAITHQIVLWNVHNAQFADSGTEMCNVILFRGENEVWRQDDVKLPWGGPKDPSLALKPPVTDYDRIRIEITKFRGRRGGLSEVAITRAGRNLLRQGKFARKVTVTASDSYDPRANESCVVDGILWSVQHHTGYWMTPDGKTGWIEIKLPDSLATNLK